MSRKPRATRAPKNPLLAAARLDDLVQMRFKVASWVSALLNDEAGLTRALVPETDALRLWGYASEDAFVRIAFKFNKAMKPKRTIRPPELILHVLGKNVGDLIDFITTRLLYQPVVPDQPVPVIDGAVAAGESNRLAGKISADLIAVGGSLRDKIETFAISILQPAYLQVDASTGLSRFADKNTLIGLALAFISRVANGYFSRPIARDELKFPWRRYDAFPKQKDPEATVTTLVQFFLALINAALRK